MIMLMSKRLFINMTALHSRAASRQRLAKIPGATACLHQAAAFLPLIIRNLIAAVKIFLLDSKQGFDYNKHIKALPVNGSPSRVRKDRTAC